MKGSTKAWLVIVGALTAIHLAFADQYNFKLPIYIFPFKGFSGYWTAADNQTFLSYFDLNVVNMMVNSAMVKKEGFQEVYDASTFELTASSDELNLMAAKIINRMWARDFISDLNIYRMSYIHQRYLCASQQLMKDTVVNPVFEDIAFDEPLDRMVVYQWAYHLHQGYVAFMANASKLHSKWETAKEKINTEREPEE